MENMYNYSIIRVEPDPRRGERVNVGIVVFKGDGLDIRVVETRKAAAIASKQWDSHIRVFTNVLETLNTSTGSPEAMIAAIGSLDKQIALTDLGWFEAANTEVYEAQVKRIITTLIKKPKTERVKTDTNISTEIAASFRAAKILSTQGEDLSSGKVVRNFLVDDEAGLSADFALKNGALHLAAALDLTSSNPHIGTAASKAITLDLAKKGNVESRTKTYGVYAVAPSRKSEVKEHISLLGDYSDDIFNWHDDVEQVKFKRAFFAAHGSNFPEPLNV